MDFYIKGLHGEVYIAILLLLLCAILGHHVTGTRDHVTGTEDNVTGTGDYVTGTGDHVSGTGDHVTGTGDLPEKIMVQCGKVECNILEEFCTLDDRCDYCNEDECKLSKAEGERPPQCFFKCNRVMEKLKNYSTAGYPTWLIPFLGVYAALTTLVVVVGLSVWIIKTRKTACCDHVRERQEQAEESSLVSQHFEETSDSPLPAQGPTRRSPIIASPQNDRENENANMGNQ